MKRWLILLILVLPLVYGESFDGYRDLTLTFEIDSELETIVENDAKLESISADLRLFPVDSRDQEVLSLDIYSNPKAEIEQGKSIKYMWDELNSNYVLGMKAKVRVTNNIVKIKSKIRFPNDLDGNDEYLSQTEFIDINENIRGKANEIIKGETDYYAAVYKLADWTKTNIEYDLNTITAKAVKKSSWVLENKQGVCDELTNLFISMLRSVGIPARFVTGMVYTSADEGWGNHGWAEVYFPDKGWVPWDVTFGQFGWVDPSHIKLGDTEDSGESSIDYQWRSRNVEVKSKGLELKTELFERGSKFNPLVKLQVKTLDNKFEFGSYLPIGVTVENLQDHYLSDTIILTKAPEVENNVKTVLLKPREVKTIYWLSKVPDDLDSDFSYTSVLEVKDAFSSLSRSEVSFADGGRSVSVEEANLLVNSYEDREEKDLLSDIFIECEYEDREFYSDELIKVNCQVRNIGNVLLSSLNYCLDTDCTISHLGIGEVKKFSYTIDAQESVLFLVENDDLIRKENLRFDIIQIPNVYITDLNPGEVGYNVETEVSFYVNSDFDVKDVVIEVKNVGKIEVGDLKGKKLIEFNVNSKELVSGLNLKINYEDLETNKYDEKKSYPIIVRNVPFYSKWWSGLKGLI